MPVAEKQAATSENFKLRHHSDDRPANPNKLSVLLVAPSPQGLLGFWENASSLGQEPGRRKLFQKDFDDTNMPMKQATMALLERYLRLKPPQVEFLDCLSAPFHEKLPQRVRGMTYTNTYYAAALCQEPWEHLIENPIRYGWQPLDELLPTCQTFKVKPYTACLRMLEPLIGKFTPSTEH